LWLLLNEMKTCIKRSATYVNRIFSKRLWQSCWSRSIKRLKSYICGFFFVGDNYKKNIEVILISTLVSGSVLTLVIVITIYLFWKSKQKQWYLLLQIHESNKICPCKVNFHPYWFSNQCYIVLNFKFITMCLMY
jgi:hypothetical protein